MWLEILEYSVQQTVQGEQHVSALWHALWRTMYADIVGLARDECLKGSPLSLEPCFQVITNYQYALVSLNL